MVENLTFVDLDYLQVSMERNKWYFYQGGYLRTSSKEFNMEFVDDKFAHLTNDAIQHLDEDYGKYETWNKISFIDFEKYLENNYLFGSFYKIIYPKIK